MDSRETTGLCIGLLGAFRAEIAGVDLPGLHERHGREILAYLAVHYGKFVSNEVLLDTFIPDAQSSAALRQSLAHLRVALGEERSRLETYNGAVRLNLSRANCDLAGFDAAVAAGDSRQVVDRYDRLLEGWSGEWVERERRRRQERFLRALKGLAENALRISDCRDAADLLLRYLRYRPGEEWAWIGLMGFPGKRRGAHCGVADISELYYSLSGAPPFGHTARNAAPRRRSQRLGEGV